MKFTFHGGAREVGKSCIELISEDKRYLLDAGLKFKENGFEAPFEVLKVPEIHGLFLSHAHLDHTGALPLFEHENLICPIFCTEQTMDLTEILLKDSYKIARIRHLHPAYEKMDLRKVKSATKIVKFNNEFQHLNLTVKFINSGHIPGSAMILIKTGGKKILYTGDMRLKSSLLMKGAESNFLEHPDDLKDIDVLITESTYGNRSLPNREELAEQFLNKIEEGSRSAQVLIPVFALGRAQEVLMLLAKRKWAVPIYYDGMLIQVTKKILNNDPMYLNDRRTLKDMFGRVDQVKKLKKREKIMNNNGIFVATSGMLQGGPVISYLSNMWGHENNSIFLTGFQCKRTNGRLLLDEGYVYLDGWKTYVKCHVEKFDFSGHSDGDELKEFITKVNPKNLIINHGDEECAVALGDWVQKNTQMKVFIPKVGDSLEF